MHIFCFPVKPVNIGNNLINPSELHFILIEFTWWRNKGVKIALFSIQNCLITQNSVIMDDNWLCLLN